MGASVYDCLVEYVIANQDKFYRLAYSYVRNQQDALDVVQNAICKALEKYGTLREQNAMKTWFYTILVNESLRVINQRKRNELITDTVPEPVYVEKGFELQDEIHEKVRQLEEPERSIIHLRFFEEMSLKEISEIMKMNINTVKSRLYRGLDKLSVSVKEGV